MSKEIIKKIQDGELCQCGRFKPRFKCNGCDFGPFCGYCCRPVIVLWMGSAMKQRLCPACRLEGENPMQHGIFDARKYSVEDFLKRQ